MDLYCPRYDNDVVLLGRQQSVDNFSGKLYRVGINTNWNLAAG